jgi:hypothetical protein
MSLADLYEAFGIIDKHREEADFEGPADALLIAAAERTLGLTLPSSYKEFLARYGAGDIAGEEFYGVIHENFQQSGIPDAVWLTMNERRSSSLPHELVIVYTSGDGVYFALDCQTLNEDGECPVVAWGPAASKEIEAVAEDFGQFLRNTLEAAIL